MIEFEGKKFLNEQEAYLYCLEQIKIIKQSLGNALPDPIQGPQGETGATGARGPEGPKGNGIYGCTAVLPSATAYQEGDMYLLFNGQLYKKINGSWVMQTTLKGPQGPVGLVGGSEVVANPVDAATDELEKVKIDGTTYNIKDFSSSEVSHLKNIASNTFIYDTDDSMYVFDDVPVNFTYPVYFDNAVVISNMNDIVDSNNDPLIICENFNDANGNARFVEGNINTETISGVTFTYHKWSLSGSHLMLVLAGEIANGTSLSVQTLGGVDLPDYINQKISAVFASTVISINDARGYYDDWNSFSLQTTLMKTPTGVYFYLIQTPTAIATAHFRIQFDLLIDME